MSAGAGSDPDDAGGGVSGAPGGDSAGPATGDSAGPAADSRAPGPGARLGMIWARDRTGLLGDGGVMLWRVPADFRHFKATTLGGALIMGRVTWESIGSALPGRRSIVLTRNRTWGAPGAIAVGGLEEALRRGREALDALGPDPREGARRGLPRMWVIGGADVYGQVLDEDLAEWAVVSTLALDASDRVVGRAVRAPELDEARWRQVPTASDALGRWRPVSGDAAWRVDHWARRDRP